jgi:hypothetical protein
MSPEWDRDRARAKSGKLKLGKLPSEASEDFTGQGKPCQRGQAGGPLGGFSEVRDFCGEVQAKLEGGDGDADVAIRAHAGNGSRLPGLGADHHLVAA